MQTIVESILEAMAWKRQIYVEKIRANLFMAFGEYMCRQVFLKIGERDYWSNDVRHILRYTNKVLDSAQTQLQFRNRVKAFAEAISDAIDGCYLEVVNAKNKVIDCNISRWKEIKVLDFDEKQEFRNMIKEFLPQYYHLLEK